MSNKRVPKVKTAGISDVAWGDGTASNAVTVETIKSIDKSLTPSEAYLLCIAVRSAQEARATNVAKAKWRMFFRKSGDEIIGGPLYDLMRHPAPGYSAYTYTKELVHWYDTAGEMVSLIMEGTGSRPVAGLTPLSPLKLVCNTPVNPNTPQDIKKWRYTRYDGTIAYYLPEVIMMERSWNPINPCRGVSPLLSGINQISAAYQATAYNRRYFINNCEPSHIIVLPPGTTPKDREKFKDEYISNHSTFSGNAHKVTVVTGGQGFDIKSVETDNKDGQFLGLQKLTTSDVFTLYGVPPVISGDWANAKYDSADVQNEIFAESKLMPLMELLSQMHQTQLVDRYFRNSSKFVRAECKPVFTKNMQKAFDQAMDERMESDIIIMLDPDTLPIMGKIKSSKVSYAQELQNTFKISPMRAAQECGFDFEENDANTQVWVKTNETIAKAPEVKDVPVEVTPVKVDAQPDQELTDEEKNLAEEYRLFYRDFRKSVLSSLDNNQLFTLAAADAAITTQMGKLDKTLREEVRRDYHALYTEFKEVHDADARKALVKEYFNTKNRSHLKSLARSK